MGAPTGEMQHNTETQSHLTSTLGSKPVPSRGAMEPRDNGTIEANVGEGGGRGTPWAAAPSSSRRITGTTEAGTARPSTPNCSSSSDAGIAPPSTPSPGPARPASPTPRYFSAKPSSQIGREARTRQAGSRTQAWGDRAARRHIHAAIVTQEASATSTTAWDRSSTSACTPIHADKHETLQQKPRTKPRGGERGLPQLLPPPLASPALWLSWVRTPRH